MAMIPCGPDPERCDYSFVCSNHQEQIEEERAETERMEGLEILRSLRADMNTVLSLLRRCDSCAPEFSCFRGSALCCKRLSKALGTKHEDCDCSECAPFTR